MGEKNKDFTISVKTFFKKISDFFKNLFKKEEKLENVVEENAEDIIESKEETKVEKTEVDDKTEFFQKYEAFKAKKIDVSELSGSELVKMNAMLEEENKMNKNKLLEAMEELNKKNSESNN